MSNTALIYGDSGIGKTANLQRLASYLLTKYPEKLVRLVSSDGGGWAPFEQTGLIEAGKVKTHSLSASEFVYAEMNHLSLGYWPRGDGKWQKWGAPTSAYLIEGLESFGDNLLSHFAHQSSERAGFKHSWGFKESLDALDANSPAYYVGGLDKGHFGMVQTELLRIHKRGFANLPADWVVWTSKVSRGEDSETKETVFGPALVGTAKTTKLTGDFGDCLHLDEVMLDGKPTRVAWFTSHQDRKTGIKYIAKSRVTIELIPYLYKKWPNGFIPLTFDAEGNFHGIEQYWQFLLEFVPIALTKLKERQESMKAG
jgi:hypothetical protein